MDDFKTLMGGTLNTNEDWELLGNLYEKFVKNQSLEITIPKKIHQIWIGQVPEYVNILHNKIKEKHPQWECKLWTDEVIKSYSLKNKTLFDSQKNLGCKSDILRYEILYNEGGIYLDTDFEIVSCFDNLINMDFFTGCGHITSPEVFNGLIGCKKNHPIIDEILTKLSLLPQNTDLSNITSIMESTGPYFFSKVFFDYIRKNSTEKIVVLPTPYFYPLPASERHRIRGKYSDLDTYVKSFNTDKTICIHLWYNSWQ